ncbi:hypothetical protein D3C80_1182500 [compost metagenome]
MHGHDLDLRRLHRILEACGAGLGIGGGGHTFDDADFITGLELLGQVLTHQARALAVVRAYERYAEVFALEDIRVQTVVDVDHGDAGVHGLFHHRHQSFGVRWGNDQGVDPGNDHLLDNANLVAGIGLVLDAVGNQLEFAGVVFLVGLGAVFHGQEELVGEGFHHQRHFRLGVVGLGLGQRHCEGERGQYGDRQKASCERQLHVFTPNLMIFIGSQTFALTHYGNATRLCQIRRRKLAGSCLWELSSNYSENRTPQIGLFGFSNAKSLIRLRHVK